jgi:hypothetical protein
MSPPVAIRWAARILEIAVNNAGIRASRKYASSVEFNRISSCLILLEISDVILKFPVVNQPSILPCLYLAGGSLV